jgi:hypothetical protein
MRRVALETLASKLLALRIARRADSAWRKSLLRKD